MDVFFEMGNSGGFGFSGGFLCGVGGFLGGKVYATVQIQYCRHKWEQYDCIGIQQYRHKKSPKSIPLKKSKPNRTQDNFII